MRKLAIVAGVCVAVGGLWTAMDIRSLRQTVHDHVAYHTEDEASATLAFDRYQLAQRQLTDQLQREVLRLQQEVLDLRARKPEPQETGWMVYRFNRVEQRIGALEHARWGTK